MIPLAENPHINIQLGSNETVVDVTTNVAPGLVIRVTTNRIDFMEASRGDSFHGEVQYAHTHFDPSI
jgi:hypothetical protein